MHVQINAIEMKNFAILEDLDQDHYQDLLHKNHQDLLTDSFIRNFSLIKKYAHSEDQLLMTKFKKKIIPKYLQQLQEYCQSQVAKNRQLFYARRKNFNDNTVQCRKNCQSLPELSKTLLLNQYITAPSNQVLQLRPFQKSFPILFHGKPVDKKDPQNQNLSKTHIEKTNHSSTLRCGPMFLISPKKKLTGLEKISKTALSKSYTNIYSDSIIFCQNILFKNTFDQIGSKKQQRQSTEGLIQIFNVKRSLADEKSIEKKMMNVLKKRKSSKNLKIKMFSGYIKDKHSSREAKDKQNFQKLNFNELNKQGTQPLLKNKIGKLGLKGKICIPMKNHKVTTSCLLEQHLSRQTFQVQDQIIDLPSINGRNHILNEQQPEQVNVAQIQLK